MYQVYQASKKSSQNKTKQKIKKFHLKKKKTHFQIIIKHIPTFPPPKKKNTVKVPGGSSENLTEAMTRWDRDVPPWSLGQRLGKVGKGGGGKRFWITFS